MIITSLNYSEKMAKKIAKDLNVQYMKTLISEFPDRDIYLKFNGEVKGKKVIIVETFQPDANFALYSSYFAAKAARQQGAKKVILVAPYLAFMRQDKMFKKGEVISARVMADMINDSFDKIITIDPHLHRIHKMKDLFKIQAKNLTANSVIGNYIKEKIKNPVIIGPDWESYQWADEIAKIVGSEDTVLEKTRHSSRKVDVEMKKEIKIKGKNVIIVDDIISTGNTMIKALKEAKKRGAKTVNAIGVHGLFVEKGLNKMKKAGFDKIITVNTIKHETNKIDISPVLVEELKKELPKQVQRTHH